MDIPYALVGAHFVEWGNEDTSRMPYLWGKNLVPGAALDLDGSSSSDGPERDTLVELDVRNFSVGAWVRMNRFPASIDPFGVFTRERFPIITRSAIAGDNGPDVFFTVIGAGTGKPRLELQSARSVAGAAAFSGVISLPGFVVDNWFFMGGSYVMGGAGPSLFVGDQTTPVVETSYALRQDGDGVHGLVNPGLKVSTGHWVDRWGFGPVLLGAFTLPVPPNGPGQFYGELGPTNAAFSTMKGRIAHVTVWAGSLNVTQWETLRTAEPADRGLLPGFPVIIADWHLDESGHPGGFTEYADSSGNGHVLVSSQLNPPLAVRRRHLPLRRWNWRAADTRRKRKKKTDPIVKKIRDEIRTL